MLVFIFFSFLDERLGLDWVCFGFGFGFGLGLRGVNVGMYVHCIIILVVVWAGLFHYIN